MEEQNTGVQELQEFRRQKIGLEYEDLRFVSRAQGEELPDWEVHSATPELLNSCNPCSYYVRV
jgi:hypothetical protein